MWEVGIWLPAIYIGLNCLSGIMEGYIMVIVFVLLGILAWA